MWVQSLFGFVSPNGPLVFPRVSLCVCVCACVRVCGLDGEQAGSLSVCRQQSAEPSIVLSGMYCVTKRNGEGPVVMLHLEA